MNVGLIDVSLGFFVLDLKVIFNSGVNDFVGEFGNIIICLEVSDKFWSSSPLFNVGLLELPLVNKSIVVNDKIIGIILIFELLVVVLVTVGELVGVLVLWGPELIESD